MTFQLKRIIPVCILLVTVSGILAQENTDYLYKIYGSDPVLFNGRYYTFNPPLNTGGNQYFTDNKFEKGSVALRGKAYDNLLINFDIYNQQLIVKYQGKSGDIYPIIVSDAWLEAFSFKNLDFKVFSSNDTLKHIYQVLGSGPDYILYFWKKKFKLDNSFGATNHSFSRPVREMNLFIDNRILQYRNNKSFYSNFSPEKQAAIKEYLHKYKIRVKNATDNKMTELISYCNSLN